jgi:hypothetical protein
MSIPIDPKCCPICGKPNQCDRASGKTNESCWCVYEKFPPMIFTVVPKEKLHKACICKECLKAFKKSAIQEVVPAAALAEV